MVFNLEEVAIVAVESRKDVQREEPDPGVPVPANTAPPTSAIFAVFLCGTLAFLNLYSTQPMLPLLAQIYHASEVRVGMTVSAATLGVAISSILLGIFAERLPRKKVIVSAALLLAVPTLLAATAPSLTMLCLWRLLQGLFLPGIFVVTIAYTTEEWPPLKLPQVMSMYVAGTVLGGYLGRVLGGWLGEHYGWPSSFLTLGVMTLLGAGLVTWLLPASRTTPRGSTPVVRSRLGPLLENLRNPRMIATFCVGFAMLFTLVSMFTYVTFRLAAEPYRLSATAIGGLFSVYIAGLLVTILVGRYLTRIGLRAGLLGAIVVGVGGTLVTLLPSLTMIAVGLALVSCCVFIAQTCANSFLRDVAAPGGRVSAVGLYIMFYYIGGTAGGVLPAVAWRYAGWPGCVALVVTLLAAAFVVAHLGWQRRPYPVPL